MKVNPFKTTLYSSVLLAGLAATSVAAADEAKDVTATTDTDATVSNTAAESSANLVKTTGDAAVVTTVPGTEEKTEKTVAIDPTITLLKLQQRLQQHQKILLMLKLSKIKQLKMLKKLQIQLFLKIN